MEYYNNILCVPAHDYYHEYSDGPGKGEVVEEHCVSYSAYKLQVFRGKINVVRQGRGEGNYALIALNSIAPKYRQQLADRESLDAAAHSKWIAGIEKDYKAVEFFINFRYSDGKPIPTNKQDNIQLWSNNASILNAVASAYKRHCIERAKLGKKPLRGRFFNNMAQITGSAIMQDAWPNNLPTNPTRLAKKYNDYIKKGYLALVKYYAGNDNAVKINDKLLRLLEYIAVMPTRPYNTKVVEIYNEFMAGNRELYDKTSGEVFDPADYLDSNGEVITITEGAVWNRLSNPAKQAILDKKRLGTKDYNDTHRPHRHRHSPAYSFSKISLDDRDLIWRDRTTKKRVKAYYAYDVASGCRVGSAYSMDKDETLFLDCLRDMFVFIDRHGFGIPLEVEVENHLVNKFFPALQAMMPYCTICAPGNSQQKRAEHFNRFVKYNIEKNNRPGVGRWYLSSRYNRISVDKVDDQFKQTLKDADRMIVDDIQDTLEYNNSLHPNQKLYPGMTRMQVLVNNLNPNLPKFQKHLIYQYIGYHDTTTIMRNMYVHAANEKYMLPHPQVLEQLAPNNRTVDAYWMPNEDGTVDTVYLYQNGRFICEAERIATYNEAMGERTEADWEAKQKQDKYVALYDKYVKDNLKDMPKLEVSTADFDSAQSASDSAQSASDSAQSASDSAQSASDSAQSASDLDPTGSAPASTSSSSAEVVPDKAPEPRKDTTDYKQKVFDDFWN